MFEAEDAGEFALGCFEEKPVHFFDRDVARHGENRVGQRRIEQWNAHRSAVQLAGKLGVDHGDGCCRAGRRGDQRVECRAGPTQIFVRCIDDHLGVGDVVDGGQCTAFDADLFVQHFDHRRKTVGGARRCGDDVVGCRVVQIVVASHDDVEDAFRLDRRSDDDLSWRLRRDRAGAFRWS